MLNHLIATLAAVALGLGMAAGAVHVAANEIDNAVHSTR